VFETVQSTGQVKPLTEVQVGAQVSGRVTKVYVDFNSKVKKGDVLAEIDPTLFGAQVDSTRPRSRREGQRGARRGEPRHSRQRLERAKKLVTEGVGTQAEVDAAQGALRRHRRRRGRGEGADRAAPARSCARPRRTSSTPRSTRPSTA
jgi:HlyD family secretion protein